VSAHLLGLGFKAVMGCRTRKLVLMKLIDHCHDDGTKIFPSLDTVALAAESSRRTVQRKIDEFVSVGLLTLVRKGGNGPGSTNEYALDVDMLNALSRHGWAAVIDGRRAEEATQDVVAKGDMVTPLADDAKGDISDAKGDKSANKGDTRCHPTPQYNPHNPHNPQERERAREATDGAGNDQHLEPDDGASGTVDDPAKFEKRVKALGKGAGSAQGEWHGWLGGSIRWAVTQFGRLTDAERAEAERCRDAYLGECARQGVKPVPLGVYFRDRKWTDLSDSAVERARRTATNSARSARLPDGHAPPFGPVWSAFWLGQVMAGPERKGVDLPETPLPVHFRAAWPSLMAIGYAAQRRKGQVFAPRWHAMAEAMEAVPAGSDLARAWQALFAERRWPWFPRADGMEVVYLPKTPPGGDLDAALVAFAEALETATRTDGATGDDREA